MADSKSKKEWDRKQVKMVAAKLFRASADGKKANDQAIIDFLQEQESAGAVIKAALREYMERHN